MVPAPASPDSNQYGPILQYARSAHTNPTNVFNISPILAAVDGSETSARVFDTALALARETGIELQLLYVVGAPTMTFDAPGYDP